MDAMDIDTMLEEDFLDTEPIHSPVHSPGATPTPLHPTVLSKEETAKDIPHEDMLDTVRPEALFLKGVDTMSTDDIWEYCAGLSLVKVEWVNDTCCNLVFSTSEECTDAAAALLVDSLGKGSLTCKHSLPAKVYISSKTGAKADTLSLRYATSMDTKVKGSHRYSRYYLLHGHPAPQPSSPDTLSEKPSGPIALRLGKRTEASHQKHRSSRSRSAYDDGEKSSGSDILQRLGSRVQPNVHKRSSGHQRYAQKAFTKAFLSSRRRSPSPSHGSIKEDTNTSEEDTGFTRLPRSLQDRLGMK
ncbi:hypothetical protein BDF14DRAFT_995340 [Spinellus fusiger]|nr:hypothetical protein BDF14DRAFT_995340 [Spinellus fusiger]